MSRRRREEQIQRLARQADEKAKRESAEQQIQDHQASADIARSLRRRLIHFKTQEKHRNTREKQICTAKNVREWLIAIAAIGAFGFAASQWYVMRGQLDEMAAARRDTETQLRALFRVVNPVMFPYGTNGEQIKKGDPGVVGWSVSPGWTNVGLSAARHVLADYDLHWYPEHGALSIPELKKSCPPAARLGNVPGFEGWTIAQGFNNGFVLPQKTLPLSIAQAAERNQALIIFVLNVSYQDVFDHAIHTSYACVEVVPMNIEKSIFSFVNLTTTGD